MQRLTLLLVFALALVLATSAVSQRRSDRRHIQLGDRGGDLAQLPFSDGVLVGKTLYLAGRLGLDPETRQPPADVEAEARLVLDGMQRTLAEAGMKMGDLVSVQVFCPDLTLYERFNAVYRTYFDGEFPARAFIGSGPLLRGCRFEIQGIAVGR